MLAKLQVLKVRPYWNSKLTGFVRIRRVRERRQEGEEKESKKVVLFGLMIKMGDVAFDFPPVFATVISHCVCPPFVHSISMLIFPDLGKKYGAATFEFG